MNPKLVLTDSQKLERFSSKKQSSKRNSQAHEVKKSNVCSNTSSEFSKEPLIENMVGSMSRHLNPTDSKSRTVSQGKNYERSLASERTIN